MVSPAIAELIRAGRLRKGLNQEDLAQRAGVSRTTLHHLERGAVHRPRASTLSRLATVLELSPEELARGWKSAEGGSSADPQPLEFLSEQVAFDGATNPVVAEICEAEPDHFRGFTRADWEELSSQVGVGGGLTQEGVLEAASRIQRDRETMARLRLVLQTHLREPARQLIDALFQSVAILPPESQVPGTKN
ncbi:MAG: hypothetical protein B7Z55_19900, partial [Planctomycetales bacterium 12-60-4]